MSKLVSAEYSSLLCEVKKRVRAAQYAALRAVNKELVGLYWDIGRLIVGRQAGSSWGKAVVERLAADLRAEFPGVGGFSASNLWRMKGFFEVYADSEKLAPLVREISWTQNLIILQRCKDLLTERRLLWRKHQANTRHYKYPSFRRKPESSL